MFRNSSIVLLGLLTCATVFVQAFASSASQPIAGGNSLSTPWGTRGGGAGAIIVSGRRTKDNSLSSSSSSSKPDAESVNGSSDVPKDMPAEDVRSRSVPPIIRPLTEMEVVIPSTMSAVKAINGVARPPPTLANGKFHKTILTPGGFSDSFIPATYVAETNLPTSYGHFRIRAYRIEDDQYAEANPLGKGAGLGSEPCVIYCTDKPPFGNTMGAVNGELMIGGGGAKEVPMRIHDQCFTSEVFGSQR
jgi:hypothetical protein